MANQDQACIIFSTADWEAQYWTNKQHTAKQLSEQGFQVLYVETIGLRPPTVNQLDFTRVLTRLKSGLRPIRKVSHNLWVLSPLAIPFKQHWPLVKRLNQGFLSYRVRRFMKKNKAQAPLLWTYHPFVTALAKNIPHQRLVYHCVDDLSQIPGIDAATYNQAEERLLSVSDIVFVTSESLLAKCQPHNPNTHYLSNVVDINHFQQAFSYRGQLADLAEMKKPRLVYHGVLSNFKVDFDLLLQVANKRPDWQIVLIGEEREGQADPLVSKLSQLNNVHFLGYKPYQVLPKYLAHMSVGLLPTRINDYTKSMFPMKYYEYVAAGLPVVSTPIDFTQYTSNALLVGDSADAFIEAIDAQLAQGKLTVDRATAFVGENTWEARLQKMLKLIMVEK